MAHYIDTNNLNFYILHKPLMKLVDLRHVAKQDVFLAEQDAGDEVSQSRVVQLCCIALQLHITHVVSAQYKQLQCWCWAYVDSQLARVDTGDTHLQHAQ